MGRLFTKHISFVHRKFRRDIKLGMRGWGIKCFSGERNWTKREKENGKHWDLREVWSEKRELPYNRNSIIDIKCKFKFCHISPNNTLLFWWSTQGAKLSLTLYQYSNITIFFFWENYLFHSNQKQSTYVNRARFTNTNLYQHRKSMFLQLFDPVCKWSYYYIKVLFKHRIKNEV